MCHNRNLFLLKKVEFTLIAMNVKLSAGDWKKREISSTVIRHLVMKKELSEEENQSLNQVLNMKAIEYLKTFYESRS